MSKITLKTDKRRTTIERSVVRNAVTSKYVSRTSPKAKSAHGKQSVQKTARGKK